MSPLARLLPRLPPRVRDTVDRYVEVLGLLGAVTDPAVARSLRPAGLRGLVLRRGKQGVPSTFPASHHAHLDWSYPADHAGMAELYRRAKAAQWDGATALPWGTHVDPMDPGRPLLPDGWFDYDVLEGCGVRLDAVERVRFKHAIVAWMLSQFLHGEQGALMASAQVTEAVALFDGKLLGATQVVDEARHVEVFQRYLDTKLEKLYQINDNLFVILDALLTDGRWDMKFLGMQILVEGLALGAFGTLHKLTREPLLRELLGRVIQDEARHVHFGVLALREHMRELSDAERHEREQWAFEVALLMRSRFMAYEVYEEWFAGTFSRARWRAFVTDAPGMREFRHVMFSRLVPNLRAIGLLSPSVRRDYERAGLLHYFGGLSADELAAQGEGEPRPG